MSTDLLHKEESQGERKEEDELARERGGLLHKEGVLGERKEMNHHKEEVQGERKEGD